MKTFFVLLFSTLAIKGAFAQDGYGSTSVYDRVVHLPTDKHFFVAPPAREWNETPWKDSVYRFQSFQKGKLEMTNGFVPSHRPLLNYSAMAGAIVIRTDSNQTVVMRKSPAIRFVWIGDHKFVNDPAFGYLEIILDGKVCLAQKTYMDGIFELSNGSKYSMAAVMDMGAAFIKTSFKASTRYYWVEEQYFMLGSNMKALRCSPGALKHFLPKHKAAIKAFSKSNRINYRKREDLLKIVAYANEQAAK
jgi:hypothetical protein